MYDKLTEKTRKVISYARQEAQRMGHDYIGTEHLLLGILRERTGMAATILQRLGVDPEQVRLEVEKVAGAQPEAAGGVRQVPFDPPAEKAFDYAVEEAERLGQNYIGTEHLLVGLLCVSESGAAQALERCGVNLQSVREVLVGLVFRGMPSSPPTSARMEAELKEAQKLAAERADDPLVQGFKAVLAHYSTEEAAAAQRGDYKQAHAFRELHERTMAVFRRLGDGHEPAG